MANQILSESSKSICWKDLLLTTLTFKGSRIALLLQFFMQTCGEVPILAFTVNIFEDAGSSDGRTGTIVVGATQVVRMEIPECKKYRNNLKYCTDYVRFVQIAVFVGSFFVDKLGRKFLLITSELFMGVSLLAFGTFIYLKEFEEYAKLLSSVSWIPLACLMTFILAYAIGIGPLAWAAIGEFLGGLDPNVKGRIMHISDNS